MSRPRLAVVQVALLLVLGMSLFDMVSASEHWPFSPYRMYSGAQQKWTFEAVRAYGLPADPSAAEFPLLRHEHIAPFDSSRLSTVLQRLGRPERAPRLRAALADGLRRYERRRADGHHDGPPLRGIRVYKVHWTLDRQARNVDSPDARTLIGGFVVDDGEASHATP